MYLCVWRDFHNKQRLYTQTALAG